mmetsp:Transcript_13035/g.48371  ORF Transcript_13035/g.48371 Transcript_13035/m.48371 type:complete len:266 (+) Transcript_13035:544-1341(+)
MGLERLGPVEDELEIRLQEAFLLLAVAALLRAGAARDRLLDVEIGVLVTGAVLLGQRGERLLELHAVLGSPLRRELVQHVRRLERCSPVRLQHAVPQLLEDAWVHLELGRGLVRGDQEVLHVLHLGHLIRRPRDLQDDGLQLRRQQPLHLPQNAGAALLGRAERLRHAALDGVRHVREHLRVRRADPLGQALLLRRQNDFGFRRIAFLSPQQLLIQIDAHIVVHRFRSAAPARAVRRARAPACLAQQGQEQQHRERQSRERHERA